MGKLIRELGDSLAVFYAWQHGDGCMVKLSEGARVIADAGTRPLDFKPLLTALAEINYSGWFEIFMHPRTSRHSHTRNDRAGYRRNQSSPEVPRRAD